MAIVIKWSNKNGTDQFEVKPKKAVTIGRSSKSKVQLDDSLCSSVHFEIHLNKKGELIIKDLQSKNGVYVNGTKIMEENLYLQDEVKVGGTDFSIVASELTEEELEHLSYEGDAKKRLAESLKFKVEEVPYEPRGTRRTKDLIEEKYNINAYKKTETKSKPINFRKWAVYLLVFVAATGVFYYWFSSRYRIII